MKLGVADDAATVSGDIGALSAVMFVVPLASGTASVVPFAIAAGVTAATLSVLATVLCGVSLTAALVGVVLLWATLLAGWLPWAGLVVAMVSPLTFAGPDATVVQPYSWLPLMFAVAPVLFTTAVVLWAV